MGNPSPASRSSIQAEGQKKWVLLLQVWNMWQCNISTFFWWTGFFWQWGRWSLQLWHHQGHTEIVIEQAQEPPPVQVLSRVGLSCWTTIAPDMAHQVGAWPHPTGKKTTDDQEHADSGEEGNLQIPVRKHPDEWNSLCPTGKKAEQPTADG